MIEFVFIFQYHLIDKPMVISWEFPHRSALNPPMSALLIVVTHFLPCLRQIWIKFRADCSIFHNKLYMGTDMEIYNE